MKARTFDPRPTQRRWGDMGKRRLSLGLAVAPVPSVAIGILLMIVVAEGIATPRYMAIGGVTILLAAMVWSSLVGWVYLLLVSRRRGVLSRIECLLLGIAAAFVLPPVAELLSIVIDWITANPDTGVPGDPWDAAGFFDIFFIGLAIALMPFGLLGGWIFWRVGVRPAVTTVGDVAPVFD
jgi:hypothetical protein